jgi:two-component system chemotaxis response regulator CheB
MDGITFLTKLMQFHPMPVIVVSSLTATGTRTAIDALAAGAVDVVAKPGSAYSVEALSGLLIQKIKQASRARIPVAAPPDPRGGRAIAPHNDSNVPRAMAETTHKVLAIGASTGGVQALTTVLTAFPPDAPGTLVVQHMPPKFTASFAQRLNGMCNVRVKEAADGDLVTVGQVLIAPGGLHMVLRRSGAQYYVEVKDGPEAFHQRPSVEVLFKSVAQAAGANAVGALLTGMGADGATGLLNMREAGGRTLAQDEASCVVFGMPMEAIRCGAAEKVVPIEQIAREMLAFARARAS